MAHADDDRIGAIYDRDKMWDERAPDASLGQSPLFIEDAVITYPVAE